MYNWYSSYADLSIPSASVPITKQMFFCSAPKYNYGVEVAQDYEDAMRLDKLHKHTKWQKAINLEMVQIDEYMTFKDLGHKSKVQPPSGYKRISVVFDVKHDGCYKARLVADGYKKRIPRILYG